MKRALLDELGVTEGDLLYPVRTADGIELTRYDPAFEQAVNAAKDFMRLYPNAMKKLAKG